MPPITDAVPEDLVRECTRFLSGHGPQVPRAVLAELVNEVDAAEQADRYGEGSLIAEFEHEIAELLGKEAAVFLPSGTMAQQIALRIWADRRKTSTVAFHPTCHLELHEQQGYAFLHGLRARLIGEATRLLTLDDLCALNGSLAALLLELPQREIGGQLPAWADLETHIAWAREREIPVHLDGARLWECRPYYNRAYSDIAGLFDSVYVSFYKGLGAVAGAALVGSSDFIAEARVWQRRHGGNLIQLFPYVISARAGLRRRIERFGHYHERAKSIAAVLTAIPGISVKPDPPHTNMMHVYLHASADTLLQATVELTRTERVQLFRRLMSTQVPGVSAFELTVGDATDALTDEEIGGYFERIMA